MGWVEVLTVVLTGALTGVLMGKCAVVFEREGEGGRPIWDMRKLTLILFTDVSQVQKMVCQVLTIKC